MTQKTTVYLPDHLKAAVEGEARRRGLSEAEVIRQAISQAVSRPRPRAGFIDGEPMAEHVDELLAVDADPVATRWSGTRRPEAEESIGGYILVRIRVWPEDEKFVGECVELDVSSFGDTVDDAIRMTLEATELYLETIDDLGERERLFAEKGVTFYSAEPPPGTEVYVTVHPGEVVSSQRLALPWLPGTVARAVHEKVTGRTAG
jgi:predicted RNase H-like HicB family nuclease